MAAPEANLPLGVDETSAFFSAHAALPGRGRLVVFTGGLYERRQTSVTNALAALVHRAADLASQPVHDLADALVAAAPPTCHRSSDGLALIVIGW